MGEDEEGVVQWGQGKWGQEGREKLGQGGHLEDLHCQLPGGGENQGTQPIHLPPAHAVQLLQHLQAAAACLVPNVSALKICLAC